MSTENILGPLLRGLVVGLVLAIPVGPTAVLCMRRTLEKGMRFGFATGLGASLGDGFYGAVTAFGVAAIQSFLHHHFVTVRLVGGLFMLVLAFRLVNARGVARIPESETASYSLTAFFSGFLITVTNPMTMAGFATVFASFHLVGRMGSESVDSFLVLGVVLGSALWWFTLTLGVRRLRHVLSDKALHTINLFAGVMLAIFGIYAVCTVALRLLGK